MNNKDAYGQEIIRYYKGKPSFEVIERDDGFVNLSGGAGSYFSEYKDWAAHEKKAIKFANGRCLDIGCGAGRVILYLQKNGQSAIGIDTSPLAIKVCRLRGARSARLMGIDKIGQFRPQSFDSVVMFGNNFGLFANRKKAKALLRKLHAITSKRGTIIAESRQPYLTDNPVHFRYHDMNRKIGRMPGQLHIRARFMQYASDWFDYLLVSKEEMKGLLSGTGWRISKFINADGYRKNGVYIAVITKERA